MRNSTQEKVARFIDTYKNSYSFKYRDFENHKISSVFFYVMRRMGIIQPLRKNNFRIDNAKFESLGYNAVFKAYENYMNGHRDSDNEKKDEKELMINVFEQMPVVFSSFDFCKALVKKGYSRAKIKKGEARQFLKTVANQNGPRSMQWAKKISHEAPMKFSQLLVTSTSTEQYTQECIAHLKSIGYRVMKPINQWEEI
jgi:hypothetical protein